MSIKPRVIETKKILADPNSLSAILGVAVDPVKDLNPHSPPSDGDSFYIVSYLKGGGCKFTVLFHLIVLNEVSVLNDTPVSQIPPSTLLGISVLDEAVLPPKYYAFNEIVDMGRKNTTVSSTGLEISINTVGGNAKLHGSMDDLTIEANLPAGPGGAPLVLALKMAALGPILNYLGEGIIPFPDGKTYGKTDGKDYEYAFPLMMTSGSLTLNNKPFPVVGTSWLDREWGDFAPAQWTWMSIQLKNGVQIALWDQQPLVTPMSGSYVGGEAFATILHENGDVSVTPVEIVQAPVGAAGGYPQSWDVTISNRATLKVTTLVPGQEIKSLIIPRMEAKCSVVGQYERARVDDGDAFVEVARIQLP
ncbi:MAG: lipocalin family protein [Candidatus Binataceae bacterium]